MINHPLHCRCGTLKGYVSNLKVINRCVCYCKDCQAFAHFLGRADDVLDADGGTDIVQTLPANVTITEGREVLVCMRLSQHGLLRWYTGCCNTPVGNTMANFRVSFVGLIHSCLEAPGMSLEGTFGPVRMWVHTKSARGDVASKAGGMVPGILRFVAMVARARIDGSYKRTPLFSPGTGTPIVVPKVLSRSELDRVWGTL